MSDRELIMEIFKRLNENFDNLCSPYFAETDSEIAADALQETLFNIGLDDFYERKDDVFHEIWIARFMVKPE